MSETLESKNLFKTLDVKSLFNMQSLFSAAKTVGERYRLLRAAAPEIAIWFAPGSYSFEAVGEIPGDRPIKFIDTKLRDITVYETETRRLFIGWLCEDQYRQDLINGHCHSEKIRVVSVPKTDDVGKVNVLESYSWVSREDDLRIFVQAHKGIEKARIRVFENDVIQAPQIRLDKEDGTALHDFGAYRDLWEIQKPFFGFDGMEGPKCAQRLRNEPY